MKYSQIFTRKRTLQTNPLPNSTQLKNSAGGYVWAVDRWTLLDRFLILGSETGTYYVSAEKLTQEHAKNVIEAIKEDGERVVNRIVEVSRFGRAPKNDPAIFALALAASFGNDKTRGLALDSMPQVCRTGTHLFAFAAYCDGMRGWGRGLRNAVGRWYNSQTPEALTYGLVKYQAREGWSNRDLLRLAHPKPATYEHKALYKWAVTGEATVANPLLKSVISLPSLKTADAASLIRSNRIPREAVPTELLTSAEIWDALLDNMPLTALIRNLATMTKVGLIDSGSEATKKVVQELSNTERIRKSRLHPVAILAAITTYSAGHGVRGNGKWTPVPEVLDALNTAFYAAFETVDSSGKRLVLGLDVSGSMAGTKVTGVAGLDCRQACAAMAMVTSAVESGVRHLAFDTAVYPLSLSKMKRLDDVVNLLARTGGGGTDCAAPIRYAIASKLKVDGFVIFTDSETWSGAQHPVEALETYRHKMGINAKLIVVAMASNDYSIGKDTDGEILTVVGFDTSVPQVITQFLRS